MSHTVEAKVGNHTIMIETGKLAKQAGGSVTVRQGDTIVLVTATVAKQARENISFMPLTVDYIDVNNFGDDRTERAVYRNATALMFGNCSTGFCAALPKFTSSTWS